MIQTEYNVSLIPWMSPVAYQGNQGSCGPIMAVNGLGMMSNLYGKHFEVNAQILYNMSLYSEDALGRDIGVVPRHFMELLKTTGVTQNTDLDYGLPQIGVMPSAIDYTDATTHTITGYTKLELATQENTLSHQIARALLEGKAVFQSFNVTNNFMYQSGPLSHQSGDDTGNVLGGHFVQVVGIDTATNMETVATWGPNDGDHGYFHLNLDSFYNNKGGNQFNLDNIYVVQGFDGHDLTQNATTKLVASAYVGILDRAVELEGMKWYSGDITRGKSLADLCNDLLSSTEYHNTYGVQTNTQFVETIFHNVLNRNVDSGGLAYYLSELNRGLTKGDVAAAIIINVTQNNAWAWDAWLGDGSHPSIPKSNDPDMYMESLLFNNKLTAAQDYAITLQANSLHTDVAHDLIDMVTTDKGSIWGAALVGVREQLGYFHIDGVHTS